MIFSPKRRSRTVAYQFPNFTINNEQLSFANEFKYLGHIINNSQLDDGDIYRERRKIFYRCNVLARRFYSCSVTVKLRLFKSFSLRFYDEALWNNFTAGCLDKFRSAYVKCIKVFFGYAKFYSVTAMLTELNLQNFDSLMDKCRNDFKHQICACDNGIVQYFMYLHLMFLCIVVGLSDVNVLLSFYFFKILLFYFFIFLLFFRLLFVLWAHCLK